MSSRELRFRLPGRWFSVDLSAPEATRTSIRAIARDAVGPRDDHAAERARVRQQLTAAVDAGHKGEPRALMFSTEVAPGAPLPASLLVFEPAGLRMSPAIGDSAQAVLAVMAESLAQIDPAAHATMVEVSGPGVPVLRTHRLQALAEDGDLEGVTQLIADYWVPVPDSKQMLLVRFSTPLGELENIMLAFFDELLAVSYFSQQRRESLRDTLLAERS